MTVGMKLFSDRKRAVHEGPYPLDRLKRQPHAGLSGVPPFAPQSFRRDDHPESIVNAMGEYQAMLDAIRDGLVASVPSEIPADPAERAAHLKAFGYFSDASMVGICRLTPDTLLPTPVRNPDVDRLAQELRTKQTKTLASGIDVIMAELRDTMETPPIGIDTHTHAIVFLYEYPRDPRPDEPGSDWIQDAQAQRACLRAAETAAVLGNYIRVLGWQAKAHTQAASDVNLNALAVAAGLAVVQDGALSAPWLGSRFGLAAVTCTLEMEPDQPLAPMTRQPNQRRKPARAADPFANRDFRLGGHPFERLKRVDSPTTYIDEANVARVPKRADMFARALFGDMGQFVQNSTKNGQYVRKSAPSMAQRRALGAFTVIQNGDPADGPRPSDPARNATNIKAACYFLGVDAVGLSRCPEWAWYSHDATGEPITPTHDQAISMIIDQGYETMEGASGDDWISVAQSMRAYLRFSLLGGVLAKHIRNLGYNAKAHTVMDGEVLQPPLLLLSGLGEVSRIGEVILNPYLGPRLKSGVVTTDMPLSHDKPIDFGLQKFCSSCNKCARECPSGAITAGPKLMFNGYEIWKSDSQKCATYRITTQGGAMCGRCMKTCPWNLEGLFAEAPFRWAASHIPAAAPVLARLDDALGNGGLNEAKKWWWDIELDTDGAYRPTSVPVNRRDLQTDLKLRYSDQTLAVYPAPLAPPPWPYPFPMDREAGIAAYQAMIPAAEYRARLARGDMSMVHRYAVPGDAPVIRALVSEVEAMTPEITKYEFASLDGSPLPDWTAGAHLDVLVAPEFLRQYSMSGDPARTDRYQIGVLREDHGRGGSALMHRIFQPGRKIFLSKPINHFELEEAATKTYLMGGGIGITPMIAFAHRLHALGAKFELHYSCASRASAAYLSDLSAAPWAANVQLHFSDDGSRAQLPAILSGYRPGWHVYTCGPDRYMQSVIEAATGGGFPEEARHLEYFSPPEHPEHVNHPFRLRLKDGRELTVPADKTAADILLENGVHVDVKCADGICGVCKCGVLSGEVDHRDFVLSQSQKKSAMILCQSRAKDRDSMLELDI